jgi:hypothetical protein
MSNRVPVFCIECLGMDEASCICHDMDVFTCVHCESEFHASRDSDRALCYYCYARAGICDRCDLFTPLDGGLCSSCEEDSINGSDSDSDATRAPSPVIDLGRHRAGGRGLGARYFRRAFDFSTPTRTPSPEVIPSAPSRRRARSPSPPRFPSPPRRAPSPLRRRPVTVYVIDDAHWECGICYRNAKRTTIRCCECRNEVCGSCHTCIIVSGKRTCPFCRAPGYY